MSGVPLPDDVAAHLLERWREPHRSYHGVSHLEDGLTVLRELGAGDLEVMAFWCHDAVHTNTSPSDELASAELARRLLASHLAPTELDEVCRLVLLTITHEPERGDHRGARLVDADLHGLGLPWEGYVANIAAIRAEVGGMADEEWRARRVAFAQRFLAREFIFSTALGRARWELAARANLAREIGSSGQQFQ